MISATSSASSPSVVSGENICRVVPVLGAAVLTKVGSFAVCLFVRSWFMFELVNCNEKTLHLNINQLCSCFFSLSFDLRLLSSSDTQFEMSLGFQSG